ncbi:MAG: glycosyl hydrolase, glucoamylase [Acidobacteria bacterium]|nr:glycosyl hydrolase, glucoamylase [Acidobacteriota bacterium]
MPRDLIVGNGSLTVAIDAAYRIADFSFPHVGMENHTGERGRFGVWADDALSWVEDEAWQKTLGYLRDTNVSDVTCRNEALGLRLRCYDAVDSDANVYVRKIVVRNLREEARTIKLFLHQDFAIYGHSAGDTAMFEPESRGIIHYKKSRYFLVGSSVDAQPGVTEYACGRSGIGGTDGTWREAADGVLSMTPIAQGAVDSTIAITLTLEPLGTATAFYWICAGRRYGEVQQLNRQLLDETPSRVIARTASLYYTWVNKSGEDLSDLPEEIIDLYHRSLLAVHAHCDQDGGIISATDSDIEWLHNDHYSYVWPRDAAFVADAMDRAGFHGMTRRFLEFANRTISSSGYFLHKYHPDGTLASSWNPWVRGGEKQLPIQEDETATVLWLVARHYERTRDLEFVRSVYKRLVLQPAEFMIAFRDPETGLPLPSFDVWEERQGVFTYTCSAVCAAIAAAAELANLFNDQERRTRYEAVLSEIRDAMVKHLWLEDEGRFARGLVLDGDRLVLDRTVDASTFATFYFGVFSPTSSMVEGTMKSIRETLWVQTEIGGVARYENDAYQFAADAGDVPGNPWLICTLWLAEHAIARASSVAELQSALDLVRWVRAKARPSLVLPEQIHPLTGAPLSVSPFTWSHAQVISVVRGYLDALRRFRLAGSENSTHALSENRAAESR